MDRKITTLDYNLKNKLSRLWIWVGTLIGWNYDLERKMSSLEESIVKLNADVTNLKLKS